MRRKGSPVQKKKVAQHLSTYLSFLPTLQLQGCGLAISHFQLCPGEHVNWQAKAELVEAAQVATPSEADTSEARLNINGMHICADYSRT
jgi:hypothetical protein